jgi:Flp pilus assembly CpaF family ATPase
MVLMAGLELPHAAAREQVFAAVDVVVHVSRSADGRRFVRSLDGHDRARGELCRLDGELVGRLRELRCGC